jgi:GTP-binding protein HflX
VLLGEIARILNENRVYIDTVIPYKNAAIIAEIRRTGQLISEEYTEDGIAVKARVPRALTNRIG